MKKVIRSSTSEKVSGSYSDILEYLSDKGYVIDSVSKKPSQFIVCYKDGFEYEAEVTRYSDGSYELIEYNIAKVGSTARI